jgi:hypothetical protein
MYRYFQKPVSKRLPRLGEREKKKSAASTAQTFKSTRSKASSLSKTAAALPAKSPTELQTLGRLRQRLVNSSLQLSRSTPTTRQSIHSSKVTETTKQTRDVVETVDNSHTVEGSESSKSKDSARRVTDKGAEALHVLPTASPEKSSPAAYLLPHLNLLENGAAVGVTAPKKKKKLLKLLNSNNLQMLQESPIAEVGPPSKAAGPSSDTPGLLKISLCFCFVGVSSIVLKT